jgi:alkylation response protein AidB-like acyl-CoA dehydrogenase
MDFNFTEEQSILRSSLQGFLEDRYGFEARQKAMNAPEGWRPAIWKAFAEELGILGAPIPEDAGGLGGGPVENMVVMEELGGALVIEPYLETVVVAAGLLKHSGWAGAKAALGRIAAGEAIYVLASLEPQSRWDVADVATTARKGGAGWVIDGRKAVVHSAPFADKLLVTARVSGGRRDRSGVAVFEVDKAARGVVTRDYPTVDGRRASEIQFDKVEVGSDALVADESKALALLELVNDEAACAVCAEAIGVMRKLLADTIDYSRQRVQFGRPIGSFQVLQHRMVDMYLTLEQAISMTYYGTLMLGAPAEERAKAVSAAKAAIGKACHAVGQEAIQIHGGIGMTNELRVGWYFKRATVIEGLYGSTDDHLARYQRLGVQQAA